MRVPKSPERSYSIPYPETKAPKLDLCTAQLIRLEAALLVDRALVVSTQEHPLQSSWQGWRGWREWEPEDADMHHDGGETREDPPDNADQAGSGLPCGKGKGCKGKGKAGKCGKGKFTWQRLLLGRGAGAAAAERCCENPRQNDSDIQAPS